MKLEAFSKTVLTGDRPTGSLHLGHYVGSLQNRIILQDDDSFSNRFYMVADVQALTDNFDNPQKVRDNTLEVVLDNLAVGLDPLKTNIFIQSMIPEIAELTVFFMNLVTVAEVGRNPTVKTEIVQKDFGESVPLGFFCYPVSQAADILFCKATHVPVGEDQAPMIELSREIARDFNRIYGREIFPEPQMVSSQNPRLVGIDGGAKASKSLGNAIFLSDTHDEIEHKVMSMYTCPSKISVTDTVSDEDLSVNVVFQYLDIFDTDTEFVADLKRRYQSGETGDVEGKKRLVEVLRNVLDPIRERRVELARDPGAIMDIIKTGTEHARTIAAQTMQEVKQVMKIGYF